MAYQGRDGSGKENPVLTSSGLPKRIGRLDELANNLWWSWHPEARDVFRALDYPLWRLSGHNPVKQLRELNADKLRAAAKDPSFLNLYDSVIADFDTDMSRSRAWLTTTYPDLNLGLIGYFSAEFAIHNSLPIYAGGLGVLAGDICKEASDLGLPMIGIGFMYPQGYFHQHISAEGWQEEIYSQLNFDEAPVNQVFTPEGKMPVAQVKLEDRTVFICVWRVCVGCVNLYLLDTNFAENSPQDRQLSARLYTADREQRLQQEIVLGIGGVRVLRALGLNPTVWHANEGHTAFMTLERVREEVEKGFSFSEAVEKIQATTIFTTHTPVPAGHDIFTPQLVEKYFRNYWGSLAIDGRTFLELGQLHGMQDFNMTTLALRMSGRRHGVSQLHGMITRRMWHGLWPTVNENEVPISSITNGVHVLTWIAPEMGRLYEACLGRDMAQKFDEPGLRELIQNIPDEELWTAHQRLKRKLMGAILERVQHRWAEGELAAQQVVAMGALLDPDALTIAYVRRFTEYKRPALIFHDIERLKRLVKNQFRPVQIIFAGKSHPADFPSKYLLHRVYSLAIDHEFEGRIAFVEDYDMHIARYLVQGVDVWLNNPRRLQEACGTSGMKASANGVLHLSVSDGWWHEGYNGKNGWVIGDSVNTSDPEAEDRADAESLYHLLENEIVPLYYQRDRSGVPHDWIRVVKEAIGSIVPMFCGRRMLKEYTEQMYIPAARSLRDSEK
ncbi:MAG: alpha-glucan family phosphorylase [Chloroflexi bacterium]|nr:alpha-glucan family phosphorylase [Chloroflexota bacterium]